MGLGGAGVVAKFTSEAIGSASDISESLSKNRVLFGKYAKGIENLSERSAKSFGIPKKALLEYTGTFGNLFHALGVSNKQSAKFSGNLTKLAADMASFNNTTPEEALEAIRSGLVGETEPLRKFGVNLNQAALVSEAMASGLVKANVNQNELKILTQKATLALDDYNEAVRKHGKGSREATEAQIKLQTAQERVGKAAKGGAIVLTAQQKALAAQKLIIKQTSAAHGDFERTSKGLANQQRILKGTFQDVVGELGTKLLPTAKLATTALNNLAGDLTDIFKRKDLSFDEKINKAISAVKLDLGPISKQISGAFKGAELGDKVGEAINTLAPKIANAFAASAPRAAGAFIKAWSGANVWGRLLTAGFLLSKMGAFSAVGRTVATRFATSFAASSAEGAAAEKFTQAGRAGGRKFGRGFGLGAIAAFALVLPDLVREFNKIKIKVKTFHGIPTGVHATYDDDSGRRGEEVSRGELAVQDLPTNPVTGIKDAQSGPRPDHTIKRDSGPRHQDHRRRKLAAPHAPSGRTLRALNIGTLNMTTPADSDPRHFIAKLDLIAAARG